MKLKVLQERLQEKFNAKVMRSLMGFYIVASLNTRSSHKMPDEIDPGPFYGVRHSSNLARKLVHDTENMKYDFWF